MVMVMVMCVLVSSADACDCPDWLLLQVWLRLVGTCSDHPHLSQSHNGGGVPVTTRWVGPLRAAGTRDSTVRT